MLVTDFGTLAITGARAHDYLTQLCTQALDGSLDQPAAFLNLQGRVLFDAYLRPISPTCFWIILPQCMVETAELHLKNYARLYRVQIEHVTQLWGAESAGPQPQLLPIFETSSSHEPWIHQEILMGIPRIRVGHAGRFTAQQLELAEIGAIAFDKGCYLGQEITHRTHMRSTAKQGLYRGHTSDPEAICLNWSTSHHIGLFVAPHDRAKDIETLSRVR